MRKGRQFGVKTREQADGALKESWAAVQLPFSSLNFPEHWPLMHINYRWPGGHINTVHQWAQGLMSTSFRHLPLDLLYLHLLVIALLLKKNILSTAFSSFSCLKQLLSIKYSIPFSGCTENPLSCHSQFQLLDKSNKFKTMATRTKRKKKFSTISLTYFCFIEFELHVLSIILIL